MRPAPSSACGHGAEQVGGLAGIKTVGLLGGGVIGAGWAARALLSGLDVILCDPDPDAGRKTAEVLDNARRAWARLLPGSTNAEGRLRIVRSIAEAAERADFIQESLPEQEQLKRRLLAEADAAAPAYVVIASSTSGLLPSRLQDGLRHPERLVVGHPFNPVYLVPLVEVCGGICTSERTREAAVGFYRALGMRPLLVRKEIDGFIADRLMEALWREALWLVHDDVATTEEIDDAIRFGPGLRWAFMGTFLLYRIAGGEPGMRHFMAQFGPALKWPWTKLMDVPDLDEALLEKIVAQSDAQAGAASLRALERLRDDCLVTVMQGLETHDVAAGRVVKHWAAARASAAGSTAGHATPLRLFETDVPAEWIDYNGHVTEHRYLQVFGEATDALLRFVGMDEAYLARGFSFYTVETHVMHLAQARVGDRLGVETQLLSADGKRLHLFHSASRMKDGAVVATAEQMLLHVDSKAARACEPPHEMAQRLQRLAAEHTSLPRPRDAGRHVGRPKARAGGE